MANCGKIRSPSASQSYPDSSLFHPEPAVGLSLKPLCVPACPPTTEDYKSHTFLVVMGIA